jgi:hypothetical protein
MTQQSAPAGSDQGQAQPPRRGLVPAAIAFVGGMLTVGTLVLVSNSSSEPASIPGASALVTVAATDIAAATPTIDPAAAAGLAAEAKDCRVPLAQVTISKSPGTRGGIIRIRSGKYISPPFQVTDKPQRVAIPFPAPYATGHGVLSIDGNAGGVQISLFPAWNLQTLNGSAAHNVVWTPNKPC